MASGSSNSVNLLNVTSRPNDVKSTREVAQNSSMDFGVQFKSELNKAQPKPAEKVASAKPAEKRPDAKVGDARENSPAPENTKLVAAGAEGAAQPDSAASRDGEDGAPNAAQAADANLAALLGMVQLAQAPTIKLEPLANATTDEVVDGKSLIASIGDQSKPATDTKSDAEDLLAQDNGQGKPKQNLSASELGVATNLAANIAVDGLNAEAKLPLDSKHFTAQAGEVFADTLANKLNAPTASLGGIAPAVNSTASIAPSHQATQANVPSHYLETPVQDARWGDAVAQRVSMMLGKQEQQIEMQLNPPNLGPMEVRLNLGNEQASVVFTSQHAAVREALAAATPKLTALLADQGIVLQNVQVASDSLQQQQQNAFGQQQQANRFNSPHAGQHFGAEMLNSNSAGVERVLSLNELRVPVGSTRVSLFV